jgi:xanthine dehydrogenase accessory factor
MIVCNTGELLGSIGGGVMEYSLVETAKELLKSNQAESFIQQQDHHAQSKMSSGMICSGSQLIAFTPISIDNYDVIKQCQNSDQLLEISNDGIQLLDTGEGEICHIKSDHQWRYTEDLHKRLHAHIFGAGHVSVPVSALLKNLGFSISLYDNRLDINTFANNHHVDNKKIIDYSDCINQVSLDENDYVLIMTHKFIEDKLLLSQLLNIKVKYLGVLGSNNKIKTMYASLLKSGVQQSQLDGICAPIGLSIRSQSTEEIAVSIVAEIIKIKND